MTELQQEHPDEDRPKDGGLAHIRERVRKAMSDPLEGLEGDEEDEEKEDGNG